MTYDHSHPDAEIFIKGSEWKAAEKEITLADYIKKVTQYPCLVIGGEPQEECKDGQRTEKSQD